MREIQTENERKRKGGWQLVYPLLTTPSNINYSTPCVVVAARQ